MLAMAKGLAKTMANGSLMWVGEIGSDGVDEGQRPAARQGADLRREASPRLSA